MTVTPERTFRSRRQENRKHGRLLSVPEVADYTGLSYSTVLDAIAKGALPYVQVPGSTRKWVDKADLDQALTAWKTRAEE